jgi:predicted CXXCH cytochrome family protein
MKKVLALVAAVSLMAAATTASAASIRNSKHDLSSTSAATFKSAGAAATNQLCVFCHTPHNAVQNGYPLWNRSNPAGTNFQLYSSGNMKNQYSTGGTAHASQGFTADSISLYCMSCHDGNAVGGRVANKPSDNGHQVPTMSPAGDKITTSANLGTDLRNDHPVNFNITVAGGAIGALVNGNKGLKTAKITNALPLFQSARGGSSLECASCHSVHDPANVPFLRTTNSGSLLCLGCHVK